MSGSDAADNKGNKTTLPDSAGRYILWSLVIIAGAFLLMSRGCGGTNDRGPVPTVTNSDRGPSEAARSSSKAYEFLRTQKAKSEEVDKQAVELMTQDRMAQARKLYKSRWNEVAKLRLQVIQDQGFTQYEKERIGSALQTEQEGITQVLNKYEEMYGREQ